MDINDIRGKSSDEIFAAVAKDTGLPEQLFRNMWQTESANGTQMKSPAGAIGHMQIMPSPLKVMRKTYGEDLDPMELADSVFMAGKMMQENLQRFGNVPDAVAAYNGGWDRKRWENDETRAYVPKLLAGTGITAENVMTTTRAEQDAARPEPVITAKPYLNDIEKNAINQQMLESRLAGDDVNEVVSQAVQLTMNPDAAYREAESLSQEAPALSYDNANAVVRDDIQTSVNDAMRVENTTAGKAFDAAWEAYTLTDTLMRTAAEREADVLDKRNAPDPKWISDYESKRDTLIKGLSPNAVKELDVSTNMAEAQAIMDRDKRDQVNQQILNDSGHPILWGIGAGMLDPAGWAVGGGAGKAFAIGKGLSLAARVSRGATGGAAGNIAFTGAMDYLGNQTTAEDYLHAGAFGLVMGGGLGALSRGERQALTEAAEGLHNTAAERSAAFVEAAMKANPKATAEELGQAAAKASQDEILRTADDIMNVPNREQQVFAPKELDVNEYSRMQDTYGLDTVVDEQKLSSIGSLMKSAEAFLEQNKGRILTDNIKAQKNRELSDALGWRSAGNELIVDDNPLAKTIGMTIAEDGAGISGVRGVTAAIKSRNLNNMLNHGIERGIHDNFLMYLKDNKVGRVKGAIETYTTGKHAANFYREVATEMRNRADPEFKSSASRAVQEAANVLERGFQEMGDLQRQAKTLGHEFIPTDSRGYLPQQLNGKMFRSLSGNEKRAVQNEFTRQAVEEFGWDLEFATKKVAEYMNRAEDFSNVGARMQPGAPKDLMSVLLDELADPNLSPAEYMQRLERIRTGAAKHTGKRLDWDLNAQIKRDDGTLMPMTELYNNDILSLYKGYASRVSGDVSMAHFGIYGDRDVRMITEALQRSKVGDASKTVPAWQQVVNEIYNRPTAADSGGALSTSARFIRQYTGIRLLGGVGFAQMAELSNAVAHMGVVHTMNMVKRIPAAYREIQAIKRGEIPENSILGSLDMVAGSPMGSEQYQLVMPQILDGDLTIVDQRSFNNVMRVMGGAQMLHNKFSFMRAVSAMEQRVVSEEIVRKAFRYIKSGQEDVALKEMGFTPELVAKVRSELDNIAMFDERGYLKALDARAMKDKAALEEMVVAIRRGTGQIIQETFPGETGKWMRSEVGQILMQFRKFPSVAVEKQMYRQYKKFGFTRALGGTLATMGVGTLIYYGRAMLAASLMPESKRKEYLENRLSPASLAQGSTMYLSNMGMLSDFMQLGTGVRNLVDDQMDLGWGGARGVTGGGIGAVIPSLGSLGDMYDFTQKPSTKAALKLMPFSNLPMVLPVINAMKHAEDD